LKHPGTFEPGVITPEMVGHRRRIVVGKHAGRHQIKKILEDAGYMVDEEKLVLIVEKVKELGDKGIKVTDLDLFAITESVLGEIKKEERVINVNEVTVLTGNKITPTAVINADVFGEKRIASATGVGPVDATFKAVSELLGRKVRIVEFKLDAITGGSDALANVYVAVEDEEGDRFTARSAGEDIVMASFNALIKALNYLMMRKRKT
jgi:2-isopropylmalate synthase